MSLHQFTISELTNSERNELSYKQENMDSYNFIPEVRTYLKRAGINVKSLTSEQYDLDMYNSIKKFQELVNLTPNGILNNLTLSNLIKYVETNNSNNISSDTETEVPEENTKDTNPHYNSFFGSDNFKTPRKNRQNIKIVLGNNNNTKTIIDVFFRSQSVEYDTSGNPISEIYEFIARDIKESDEINDTDKYTPSNQSTAPSDINYNFNY